MASTKEIVKRYADKSDSDLRTMISMAKLKLAEARKGGARAVELDAILTSIDRMETALAQR